MAWIKNGFSYCLTIGIQDRVITWIFLLWIVVTFTLSFISLICMVTWKIEVISFEALALNLEFSTTNDSSIVFLCSLMCVMVSCNLSPSPLMGFQGRVSRYFVCNFGYLKELSLYNANFKFHFLFVVVKWTSLFLCIVQRYL